MNREIILDLETTGKYFFSGDRIVSVGLVELIDHLPTGEERYFEVRPEGWTYMPEESYLIHGLSIEHLSDKPLFKEVAKEIYDFIRDSTLIIHNASFDLLFLREELKQAGLDLTQEKEGKILCTVSLSRKVLQLPNVSLDKLISHFKITVESRNFKHNSLEDARILSKIYFYLLKLNLQRSTLSIKTSSRKKQMKANDLKSIPKIEDYINYFRFLFLHKYLS